MNVSEADDEATEFFGELSFKKNVKCFSWLRKPCSKALTALTTNASMSFCPEAILDSLSVDQNSR